MRNLTEQEIDKILSEHPIARARPVRNFLSTLEGSTERDARANLRQDERAYRWDCNIVSAISKGIKIASK